MNVGDAVDLTVKSTHEGNQLNKRGRINIWIDYNQDGDFDDVGEHVINDKLTDVDGNATTRETTVSFTVPALASRIAPNKGAACNSTAAPALSRAVASCKPEQSMLAG